MPISNKTPEYIKIWHATFKISSTATVNFTMRVPNLFLPYKKKTQAASLCDFGLKEHQHNKKITRYYSSTFTSPAFLSYEKNLPLVLAIT